MQVNKNPDHFWQPGPNLATKSGPGSDHFRVTGEGHQYKEKANSIGRRPPIGRRPTVQGEGQLYREKATYREKANCIGRRPRVKVEGQLYREKATW